MFTPALASCAGACEDSQLKKVLVIGGSRGIGLEVVSAALMSNMQVRAFARHAESIPLTHKFLSAQNGDAQDPADLRSALEGVDAVVLSLGVPMNLRLLTGPISLFSATTRILIPAMKQAGVRRLIAVTGFGAGRSQEAIAPLQRIGFNLVFGRAYADKSIQEEMIEQSELDWTIVRPGILTNGASHQNYRVLQAQHEWSNGIVSRRSVADFIVHCLQADTYLHAAPVIVR